MKIKTRQGIYLCLAAALLFGILAGVALPEVFRMREGTYAGFFSLYGMKKMQEMEVLLLPIFGYLLSSRLQHPPFSVDEQLYSAGTVAASVLYRVAWVLRRHAAFTFCIEAGCAGDRSLFLLHAAAVDFLRAAVEKGTAAFPLTHSAAGRFQRRGIPVSFKKSED